MSESFQKTQGKPDRAERARVFWEVYRSLDAERRAALMERVAAERRAGGGK
jgi:hypothetical protein